MQEAHVTAHLQGPNRVIYLLEVCLALAHFHAHIWMEYVLLHSK